MLKKIDYKILYELDLNSRQSYNDIAKKINTSKQVVGYHLNELTKEKYIKKFLTIFDLSKLGFILYKVYVRLFNISEEEENEIIEFLKNHESVAWLVRTEGIYDLAFALHTETINDIDQMLLALEDKYGNKISEKVVNRVITGEFFHRDYLLERKENNMRKGFVFQTLGKKEKIDDIDWKIMASLAKDSRVSVIEIAKKVPISADAVGKRVKTLERLGIIRNYVLVLDDTKLNQIHYKVLLKVHHFNDKVNKKFLQFCREHPNITFYNKNIGTWEIEIDLEVKKSEEFRGIMRLIKKEFANSVKEYFSLIVYEVNKFDFIPMK